MPKNRPLRPYLLYLPSIQHSDALLSKMGRILSYTAIFSSLTLICTVQTAGFPSQSSKRGLVYVPNANWPSDHKIWGRENSGLTWYYNYVGYPSRVYQNNTNLEFIPQLWGAPSGYADTTFLKNVTAQIVEGSNITYALGFNEPDGIGETGGSNVRPGDAARYWITQMEPLRKLGVSLGAPAVTGATQGFTWLSDFVKACGGNCTFDFVPVHWYGSFDGMASHIADVSEAYPGKPIWVTEFGLPNAPLKETQEFLNRSCAYFDANP